METLYFTAGSSWAWYFTRTDDAGNPIGDVTWGANLTIISIDNCNEELVTTLTIGNGLQWYGPGTVIAQVGSQETALWAWNKASWSLTYIAPSATDPNGFHLNAGKGLAFMQSAVLSPATLALKGVPQTPVIPFPYKG